ncbi:UNVERIFIED_CONTAM: hypothetical protein FKN15_035562 [Acipenser sinensis]
MGHLKDSKQPLEASLSKVEFVVRETAQTELVWLEPTQMDPQQPLEALLRKIEPVLLEHAQLEPAIMEYPEMLPAPPLLKYPELLTALPLLKDPEMLPALPLLKYPEMLPAPPLLKYPEMLSALPLLEYFVLLPASPTTSLGLVLLPELSSGKEPQEGTKGTLGLGGRPRVKRAPPCGSPVESVELMSGSAGIRGLVFDRGQLCLNIPSHPQKMSKLKGKGGGLGMEPRPCHICFVFTPNF